MYLVLKGKGDGLNYFIDNDFYKDLEKYCIYILFNRYSDIYEVECIVGWGLLKKFLIIVE